MLLQLGLAVLIQKIHVNSGSGTTSPRAGLAVLAARNLNSASRVREAMHNGVVVLLLRVVPGPATSSTLC